MRVLAKTRLNSSTFVAVASLVALLVVWRILATGVSALLKVSEPDDVVLSRASDVTWRAAITSNPTDAAALLVVGLLLERDGKRAEAAEAIRQVTNLAPANKRLLLESAGFYLRNKEEPQALALLRRVLNIYPDAGRDVWPVFTAALESGRYSDFFLSAARENPKWWPLFIEEACTKAVDVNNLVKVFLARVDAGVVTSGERSCFVGRIQREGRWGDAYQLWISSLPQEQRRQVGYVFNGSFESPLSNLGFDWIVPVQDGASAEAEPVEGARGKWALRVVFVNKRFSGPPIYQYLMLHPGRYRFEGVVRPDGLETWLGLQWGLYCLPEAGKEQRQLAKSERFLGSEEWTAFRQTFEVPSDCTTQVVRLELANPRHDAETAGNVVARLRGTLWTDDVKVVALD